MQVPLLMLLAFSAGLMLTGSSATAAESLDELLANSRRELEIRKIDQRHYWQVEYPRQLRELNAAIRLTQAEVEALEDRVRYYQRLDDYHGHNPLLDSLQRAELALLDAELRRSNLQAERSALRRFHGDRARLAELRVAAARARVIELERLRMPKMK